MAIFGNKKETKKKTTTSKKVISSATKSAPAASTYAEVLVRPRITEKAAQATARNVYTFEVSPRATKTSVAKAVTALYGVTPKKVAIAKTPAKRVRLRTRRGYGTKKALKKAYVFLKEGDRIEFSS